MTEITYCIHWLSVVVDAPKTYGFMLYGMFFKDLFGELQSMGHGGRGFQEIWMSLLGFKMYDAPYREGPEYFHFEIPGQACELIDWKIFQGLDDVLRNNYPDGYRYTRLDFAFDNLPFTPLDVEEAITNEKVRSLAKRETMTVYKTPFEKKENGEIGTHTVNFSSRMSERMIRVYNRRGFTRLELEMKSRRSDLVAKEILGASDVSEWLPIAISHLRDYVDFEAVWWQEFVNGVGRAKAIVSTPREITLERMDAWLDRQVAVPLSIIHDVRRDSYVTKLLTRGREKRMRGNKYDLLYKHLEEQWRRPNEDELEKKEDKDD